MKIVEGEDFTPVAESRSEPLVLHRRRGGPASSLALFVHGVGGQRYKTWQMLPHFLFEDCTDIDIALFDYVSGARRLWRRLSVDLLTTARELADIIRDVPYDTILLIGHSMGGLLCEATIKDLIDSEVTDNVGRKAVRRVVGLFLLATPQAGSGAATLGEFLKDGRILRPNSAFLTELSERFKDRVQTHGPHNVHSSKMYIPTFALTATQDLWVSRFSSQLGLPRQATKTVRGSHSSIVKPTGRDSDGYSWLLQQIRTVIRFSPSGLQSPTTTLERAQFMPAVVASKDGDEPSPRAGVIYKSGAYKDRIPGDEPTGVLVHKYVTDLPTAAVPAPGTGLLYVKFGPHRGEVFELARDWTVIGRDPVCDIWLDDGSVSRRHAEIRRSGGEFYVSDSGSTNGTHVNHQVAVAEVRLEAGVEVQIGTYRMVFLAPEPQ